MSVLNFKDAKESNVKAVQRLEYGKHPSVTFLGVEEVAEEGRSPYLNVKLGNGVADHSERMFTSPNALPYTLRNLRELAKAAGVNIPDEISVEAYNQAMTGKKFALTLNGEEYEAKDGQVKIKAVLGYMPFCAAEGRTDQISSERVKRLVQSEPAADAGQATDDLPF